MGCHVWFYRKMTDEEFEDMRDNAVEHAEELLKDEFENCIIDKITAEYLLNGVKKSVEENVPAIYGKYYWYQLGYGWTYYNEYCACIRNTMYVQVNGFFDIGRCIYTYPRKVFYSYKQFKKYVGKKWYTDVTDEEKYLIREFFWKYPGGCIKFG